MRPSVDTRSRWDRFWDWVPEHPVIMAGALTAFALAVSAGLCVTFPAPRYLTVGYAMRQAEAVQRCGGINLPYWASCGADITAMADPGLVLDTRPSPTWGATLHPNGEMTVAPPPRTGFVADGVMRFYVEHTRRKDGGWTFEIKVQDPSTRVIVTRGKR